MRKLLECKPPWVRSEREIWDWGFLAVQSSGASDGPGDLFPNRRTLQPDLKMHPVMKYFNVCTMNLGLAHSAMYSCTQGPVPVAALYGGRGGRPPPWQPFCYVWRPCAPSGEYTCICIICKIMQQIYIGNSLLGDKLVIAQQLKSDILTFFCLMYWIGRLWRQRRLIREPLAAPMGAVRGAL